MKKGSFRYSDHYEKCGNRWQCTECGHDFSTNGNVIKHIKNVHPELREGLESTEKALLDTEYVYVSKKGKEKRVLKATLKAIQWKVRHSISMEALCDKEFKETMFKFPNAIKSQETMRNIMHCMATQILENNILRLKFKKLALQIDGGTVNSTKWYSLCSAQYKDSRSAPDISLFDMILSNGDTTEKIKQMILNVKVKLEENGAIIVAVCTDNAPNLANAFLNTHELRRVPMTTTQSSALPILRVACAIHTFNLIIPEIIKKNPRFQRLSIDIKQLPEKLKHMSEEKKRQIGLAGCPKYQPQRWNTLMYLFSYGKANQNAINAYLPELKISADDYEFMVNVLMPLSYAVTYLESNDRNQAHVYQQYMALKNAWTELDQKEEFQNIGKQLVEILDEKVKYNLDINISRVVYYSTDIGISEWQRLYPPLNLTNHTTKEERKKNRERIMMIENIKNTIENLCNIWDIPNVDEQFIELMDKGDFVKDATELSVRQRKYDWLKLHPGDDDNAENLENFENYIKIIPATEASCERTFARMRDLKNENMSNLSNDSIRDELIIKAQMNETTLDIETSKYLELPAFNV